MNGLTVVNSVSVLVTPLVLMLPATVEVPRMNEPDEPMTYPCTVIRMVPPGLSMRTTHLVSADTTAHPPDCPTMPLVTSWLTRTLAASRLCVPSTMVTSSARV